MKRAAVVVALVAIAVVLVAVLTLSSTRMDAGALLRKAYAANQSLSYTGTVKTSVFLAGKEYNTTSTVWHKGCCEKISYRNGVVVISDDKTYTTYVPSKKQMAVSHIPPEKQGRMLSILLSNYDAEYDGTARIAGQRVEIVKLTPKRPGNPSKRLWIDPSTAAVLRTEDYSADGAVRARTQFQTIRYNSYGTAATLTRPETDATWSVVSGDGASDPTAVAKEVGVKVTLPSYVPAGYRIDGVKVYNCGCTCGHKAAHLRYTNGLNSISVYETPAKMACGGECKIHCPAGGRCEVRDADQAHVATAASAGRTIIVVADLPDKEIKRIAESIK